MMTNSHYFKIFLSTLVCLIYIPCSLAEVKAGKTMIASGKVVAVSADNDEQRPLKRRSAVFSNDIITTGPASKTQLRMIDGSMIALKENTELTISQYEFNNPDAKNSAVLDLVKGGLRSITGAIKAENGQYKLKTPVGSIGIRGTHYQVEVVNDTVWIAVWDGAIDVIIDIGAQAGTTLSLGTAENYAYASIDSKGVVKSYVVPPEIFNQGLSSSAEDIDASSNAISGISVRIGNSEPKNTALDTALIISGLEQNLIDFVNYDELNAVEPKSIYELAAAKQGSIVYSNALFTSDYNLSNFTAGMTIDFDTGRISNGLLSFNDDRSDELWNAVFNGNMYFKNETVFLEVGITFASHGDNLAAGNISAGFIDFLGLGGVVGAFELYELDSTVRVDGSYLVTP